MFSFLFPSYGPVMLTGDGLMPNWFSWLLAAIWFVCIVGMTWIGFYIQRPFSMFFFATLPFSAFVWAILWSPRPSRDEDADTDIVIKIERD